MAEIPGQYVRFRDFKNGLKLIQGVAVHGRQIAIRESAKQQVGLLSTAMPASEVNPFTAGRDRFIIVLHGHNTNSHNPGPE